MADRFADNFFGSYLMGGRPEFGMSPFAPTHPAQSPAEDIGTKAALLRGVLPFAPGGGIMELPETQRQYQTAKQQIGEGNYGQAIVPGLLAGLGGLDATADAAMAAAGIWPPVLAGALGAKLLAKSGKAALKATDLDPSGFYSPTRRAIEGLQDTGTGNQFAGQLGGVAKVKEMEDSGVTALLASRGDNRITKEELLEQHDRGRPQFREKWKSEARADEAANWTEEDFGWALREAEARGDQAEVQYLQEAWDGLRRVEGDLRPRWGEQVIPGGENYQELLLTLPKPSSVMPPPGARRLFTGGHDSEPNVLIRVRMDDRIDADGNRSLFLQELQSDWQLEGRRVGYANPARLAELKSQRATILEKRDAVQPDWWNRYEQVQGERKRLYDAARRSYRHGAARAQRPTLSEEGEWKFLKQKKAEFDAETASLLAPVDSEIASLLGTVPDAPLKGVWSDTAMRRMIRHASENGYDSISWTTGRMQQDRYDLSKHIDNIEYKRFTKDGRTGYDTKIRNINGYRVSHRLQTEEELSASVGKEMADKIIKGPDSGKFTGLDLKVGGEWAENLYDKQLVNAANKWAKKRGGKVRKGTIERSPTPEDATRSMETWTLDITPEMKTGALLEGMPMYGLGAGILTAAAARGIGETEREAY